MPIKSPVQSNGQKDQCVISVATKTKSNGLTYSKVAHFDEAGGKRRLWVTYVHACNIWALRADRPNWLPDPISLGEDERKHLDHRQLVLGSEGDGVWSLRHHSQRRRELETSLRQKQEKVATEDETSGKTSEPLPRLVRDLSCDRRT